MITMNQAIARYGIGEKMIYYLAQQKLFRILAEAGKNKYLFHPTLNRPLTEAQLDRIMNRRAKPGRKKATESKLQK